MPVNAGHVKKALDTYMAEVKEALGNLQATVEELVAQGNAEGDPAPPLAAVPDPAPADPAPADPAPADPAPADPPPADPAPADPAAPTDPAPDAPVAAFKCPVCGLASQTDGECSGPPGGFGHAPTAMVPVDATPAADGEPPAPAAA